MYHLCCWCGGVCIGMGAMIAHGGNDCPNASEVTWWIWVESTFTKSQPNITKHELNAWFMGCSALYSIVPLGGGRVTRFRFVFGPLNVFVHFTWGRWGKFSKQATLWRWLSNWWWSLAVTKQLYEWFNPSVCPSIRLPHLFDNVPVIISSWNFQG